MSQQRSFWPDVHIGRRTGRQLNINTRDGASTIHDYLANLPEDSGDELSFIPEIQSENRSSVHRSPAPRGDLCKSRPTDSRRSHVLISIKKKQGEGDVHRNQEPADACKGQKLANARRNQALDDARKSQPQDDIQSRKQVEGYGEKQVYVDPPVLDGIVVFPEDCDAVPASHSPVLDQPASTCKYLTVTVNRVTPRVTTGLDRGQNPSGSISRVYQMPSPRSVLKGVVSKKRLMFDDDEETANPTVATTLYCANPPETTALKPKNSSVAPTPSTSTSRYLILNGNDEFCDDFEVFDDDTSSNGWISLSHSKNKKNAKEKVIPTKQNSVHDKKETRNKNVNVETRAAATAGPSALAGAVTTAGSQKVVGASSVKKTELSKSRVVKERETKDNYHRISNSVKSKPATSRQSQVTSATDKTKAHTPMSSHAHSAITSHKATNKSKLTSASKRRAKLDQDDEEMDYEGEEVQEDQQLKSSSAEESSQAEVEDSNPEQTSQRLVEEAKATDFWEEDNHVDITSKALSMKRESAQQKNNRQTKVISKHKMKPKAAAPQAVEKQSPVMRSRRVSKPPGEWWVVTDIDTVSNCDNRSGKEGGEHRKSQNGIVTVSTRHQSPSHSRKKSLSTCPPPSLLPSPSPSLSPVRELSPSPPHSPSPSPLTKVTKSRKSNDPGNKWKTHTREEALIPTYTPRSILKHDSHKVQKSHRDMVNFFLSSAQCQKQENQEMDGNERDDARSSQSTTAPPRKSTLGTNLARQSQQGLQSAFSTFSAVFMDTPNSEPKKDRSEQLQSGLFVTPHSEFKCPPKVASNRPTRVSSSVHQRAPQQPPQQPPRSPWHQSARHSGPHQQPEPMVTDTDSSLQQTDDSVDMRSSQNKLEKLPWSSIQDSVKTALHQRGSSKVAFQGRPEATQSRKRKNPRSLSPSPKSNSECDDDDRDDEYQEPNTVTTVESNSTVETSQSENMSVEEPSDLVDSAPLKKHQVYGDKPAHSEESFQDDSIDQMQRPKNQLYHKKIKLPTNTPGMRRSARIRVPTLKFWQGERINYKLRRSGGFLVSGIISPEQLDVPRYMNPSKKERKKKKNSELKQPRVPVSHNNNNLPGQVNLSIHTEELPEEMDLADLIEGTPVLGINIDEEFIMDCVRTQDMCAYHGPNRQPLQATDSLGIWKALSQPSFACGYLLLRPQQEKGLQYVNMDTMLFNIVQGKVAVTIHNSNYILQTGDMFIVPPGNVYNVRNLRHDQASLFFTQLKGK